MTYSTRNRVSDANDVLGLRCSGRLLAWILLLASSVFLSNASPIERDGVGSEGARDCSANSLLALTLRNAHWKLRDFSQNPVSGCGGSAEQRGAGPLSQRLRGGRGQGEREFVGEGGKTIKLNADGEVVASDIKSVKVTKDKRWTEKRLQGELRRETKCVAVPPNRLDCMATTMCTTISIPAIVLSHIACQARSAGAHGRRRGARNSWGI